MHLLASTMFYTSQVVYFIHLHLNEVNTINRGTVIQNLSKQFHLHKFTINETLKNVNTYFLNKGPCLILKLTLKTNKQRGNLFPTWLQAKKHRKKNKEGCFF